MGSRVAHVRELKTQVEKLKAENARLRDETTALKAHFDLALIAAQDLREEGGVLELWDGWNLILGAKKEARDKADLRRQAQTALAADPHLRVWIVFDGRDERAVNEGALRISYTGGEGSQRADRFICDYVRMAKYLGLSARLRVRTNDKDLNAKVRSLQK